MPARNAASHRVPVVADDDGREVDRDEPRAIAELADKLPISSELRARRRIHSQLDWSFLPRIQM